MTVQEMLTEIAEIHARYPHGTTIQAMDPEDQHRLLHLKTAIDRKAALTQTTMLDLEPMRAAYGRQTRMSFGLADQPAAQLTLLEGGPHYHTIGEEIEDLSARAARLQRRLDHLAPGDYRRRAMVENLTQLVDEIDMLTAIAAEEEYRVIAGACFL